MIVFETPHSTIQFFTKTILTCNAIVFGTRIAPDNLLYGSVIAVIILFFVLVRKLKTYLATRRKGSLAEKQFQLALVPLKMMVLST